MSSAAVEGGADARIHRRVEHVMGMPISLAMRGRYAATPEADRAWQSGINQLREVDQVFSTYREDSVINRLDRGELALEQCPAEVAEGFSSDEKPSNSPLVRFRSCFGVRQAGTGSIPAES